MSTETIQINNQSQILNPETILETSNWKTRFFSIWLGQAASLIGSSLTQFVLVWWITQTTGSASALATASIMAMLPQALFGPLGGILADRYSRRLIMIVSDLITALCMVVLIVLFTLEIVQLWHIFALMFIRSTMQAFQSPASAASTSMLVPNSWLTRVAGMNQTINGLMIVAAAPLGALAMGFLPLQGALMIDVVTAIIGILPLLFYRIPQHKRHDTAQVGMWKDFRAGLKIVLSSRGLIWLYALTIVMVMVLMPAFSLMPLFVKDEFGGGFNEVALIEGLGGLGMLLGGVLISVFTLPWRRITIVLLGFGSSCAFIALTGVAPGSMFWLAVVFWFLSGIPYTMGNGPIMAILQTIVPNQLQGRALALFSTCMGIAGPLGLVFAAPLAELIGVRGLLIGGGGLATLLCLIGFFVPSLMKIEEQGLIQEPNQS
jgi:DHA3 family macrolide efflux protein-like MFS transporter